MASLPQTPTERLMLEALLRDERTGPPSAAAIRCALQALVPTPPAAVMSLGPPGAAADAAAAGAAAAASVPFAEGQQSEGQRQGQSQQLQRGAAAGDARPSLKEQAQARRAARRQSQVRLPASAALQHTYRSHKAGY